MSAKIKGAVNHLYEAVQALEDGLMAQTKAAKNAPRKQKSADLFSIAPAGGPDTKALASRLDGAIAKVEKLLKEG